jgi:hypothetical protein
VEFCSRCHCEERSDVAISILAVVILSVAKDLGVG